jgi:uncharacterized protein (TIGR02145 family)
MRYLIALLLAALSLNIIGQTNQNYNPDSDNDGVLGVQDLLVILTNFGDTWYSVDVIAGCTYPAAVEYNSSANLDDGSCTFLPDCAGVINGTSVIDECGVCGGDNSTCLDECGVINGDNSTCLDECGVPNGDNSSCADECGVPNGDDSSCADECGVTNGDNSTCTDCLGVVNGDGLVSHQGYDYSTVQIGEQCWFSENCRYLPEVSPSSANSTTDPYYYVYDYQGSDVTAAQATTNYATYGVLYNWPAVMTEGICPSGWHIPSDGEWQTMEISLGMSESEAAQIGWRGSPVGDYMKSTSGWNSSGNGSNTSGFNGLPGGCNLDGISGFTGFNNVGSSGYWWSASEYGSNSWFRELYFSLGQVHRTTNNRNLGFSARCVRD